MSFYNLGKDRRFPNFLALALRPRLRRPRLGKIGNEKEPL